MLFVLCHGNLTLSMQCSSDLVLFLLALNNSCKKRLDTASRKTAHFLNTTVFGLAGPVRMFAKTLGATGEHQGVCLLNQCLPPGWCKPIFPLSDAEAAGGPLVKGKHNPELQLAIGALRMFNTQLNAQQKDGHPRFDWHNEEGEPMVSVGGADPYGPLTPSIWDATLAVLSSKHRRLLDKATTAVGVSQAVAAKIYR